jgi:Holliday junction DNA helicase RuvA
MFNSITGEITYKGTLKLNLLTNGIEWDITCTSQSLDNLPDIGQTAKIFIYLHHREDQLKLFGFSSQEERSLFLDLIKVGGLGPRLAIKILSSILVEDFIKAVENEDVETLSTVPGLGKKTSQKVILQLKGKLATLEHDPTVAGLERDITNALVGMGFDKRLCQQAVRETIILLKKENLSVQELEKQAFTRALNIISKEKAPR